MKIAFFLLSILTISVSPITLSFKDLSNVGGITAQVPPPTCSTVKYELQTTNRLIQGFSSDKILALYIKDMITNLTCPTTQIKVVRLERSVCGKYYKILIRTKDASYKKNYIGMALEVCNYTLEILKFFQSNDVSDIIHAFKFINGDLYNYHDGDISTTCKRVITNTCQNLFSTFVSGSDDHNHHEAEHLLSILNNLEPLDNVHSSNDNSPFLEKKDIHLNIAIPGLHNGSGETIMLGKSLDSRD